MVEPADGETEIAFLQLDADAPPTEAHGGQGRGSAAGEGVEDEVPLA